MAIAIHTTMMILKPCTSRTATQTTSVKQLQITCLRQEVCQHLTSKLKLLFKPGHINRQGFLHGQTDVQCFTVFRHITLADARLHLCCGGHVKEEKESLPCQRKRAGHVLRPLEPTPLWHCTLWWNRATLRPEVEGETQAETRMDADSSKVPKNKY